MAEEALTGRIDLLLKSDEKLPPPSDLDKIKNKQNCNFATLIKTDKNIWKKKNAPETQPQICSSIPKQNPPERPIGVLLANPQILD